MGDTAWALMSSIELAWVLKIVIVVMAVGLIVYAFTKEGRDERGRAIIGTASIWGLAMLFLASNVYSFFTATIIGGGPVVFTNAYCLVGLVFLLALWTALLILRKMR